MLAGCAPRGAIVRAPEGAVPAADVALFVAASRSPDPARPGDFGPGRSPSPRFARYDIAVPADHAAGRITYTRPGDVPDPQRDFLTVADRQFAEPAAFRRDLARALAERPAGQRDAVIFVHGFNTTFAEGIYRMAQLSHDLGLPGVPMAYSWPSEGRPLAYGYDRDSALFARDGLERLIEETAAARPDRILLVAHSMGAEIVMEVLRQMAIGDSPAQGRIGGVVLISPDLDVALFRAQAARIGPLPQPFLIFTSRRDRALALSSRLSGEARRLGNLSQVDELAELEVTLIDVTSYSTGVGHFTPATSPALLRLLASLREVDAAFAGDPSGRAGLLPGAVLTVQQATQVVLQPGEGLADVLAP